MKRFALPAFAALLSLVTIAASAPAHAEDPDCPHMHSAARRLIAAKDIFSKEIMKNGGDVPPNDVASELVAALADVQNGMSKNSCENAMGDVAADDVLIPLGTGSTIVPCPRRTVVLELARDARNQLVKAIHDYDGLRAAAEAQTQDAIDTLNSNLESDPTCQ